MERRALSVIETGEALGWSTWAVYRAIRARRIPAVKVGKRLLVPVTGLDEMLKGGAA